MSSSDTNYVPDEHVIIYALTSMVVHGLVKPSLKWSQGMCE